MRLDMLTRRAAVYNEPIDVTERRHNYFPLAFRWHGHCYRVHAVERCWTVQKLRRDAARLCFLVRCAEGKFEVYQNLATNTWHLHRAEWQTAAGRA